MKTTITNVINTAESNGIELTIEQVKDFFDEANGNPSLKELMIFTGELNPDGTRKTEVKK